MYSGLGYRSKADCTNAAERMERQVGQAGRHPIIHRDIKPKNIFLKAPSQPYDSYPEVVLGDFDSLM
jgi:serine/threonine protein kinase